MPSDLFGQIGQSHVVGSGQEQSVAVIDRVNIEEGHGLRRFNHLGGRDFALDDLAEDAVRIVHFLARS